MLKYVAKYKLSGPSSIRNQSPPFFQHESREDRASLPALLLRFHRAGQLFFELGDLAVFGDGRSGRLTLGHESSDGFRWNSMHGHFHVRTLESLGIRRF